MQLNAPLSPACRYFALPSPMFCDRSIRLDAALESLRNTSEARTPNLFLYNCPSFPGAYGALFAHLYHSRLNLPCSSVIPFRLIGFDHRQSAFSRISSREYSDVSLTFHVNIEKSSSTAAYEYFSAALMETRLDNDNTMSLLNPEEREHVQIVLKYIEDEDLRKWRLPDIQAFKIGLRDWLSKLNCITNPWMYQQLMEISAVELIKEGKAYLLHRKTDANKLLPEVFRVRLGRGFYGECLGFSAVGYSELSDEIGKELSEKSVAAWLRPIGAVIYMQRNNLKMCLRTTDSSTDTSEIAKTYGGGGLPSSSPFIIRMDKYNKWLSPQ